MRVVTRAYFRFLLSGRGSTQNAVCSALNGDTPDGSKIFSFENMSVPGLILFGSSLFICFENNFCGSVCLIDHQRCHVFEPSRLLTCHNDDLGGVLVLPVELPMHVLETHEI